MARPAAPFWLATPTRFAALSPHGARVMLGAIALMLLVCLTALAAAGPPPVGHASAARDRDQTDVVLYETIVEGVRSGDNYYAVAADALRRGDYPLRPFVTFRMPALAEIEAWLPNWALIALLYGLALAVGVAWWLRLRPAFTRRPPALIAMALLAGGMMAFVQSDLIAFHEIWAGLLIALSLAVRRDRRWIEAAALGLMAMLIRETAALYVGLMLLIAVAEGARREAIGWGVTILLFGVAVLLHAHAVAEVVHASDPASPGWAGMLGPGFFVKTMTISTALAMTPLWLAAPLVGLAVVGWAGWRTSLALRVVVTLCAYGVLIALFGRTDTFYWGLMIAPTFLVGLAFLPDALADLVRAATARPRITVTRVVR